MRELFRLYVARPIKAVFDAIAWVIGLVVLVLLLGLLAAIPGLNLLALGVLLDAEGRVARSGRLRDGFPLVPLAPRIGSIALGVWLCLLPVAFVASWAADARILHPGSRADIGWHRVLAVLEAFVLVHLSLALATGGRLSRFARPLRNLRDVVGELSRGKLFERIEASAVAVLEQLAPARHLWLGLRGFAGAALWLWVPTLVFASNERPQGPAMIFTLIGGVLLMLVLAWVPFMQGRFAATGEMSAFKGPGEVRRLWSRAPLAFLVALLATLALSLPLFLFKIVLPPRDALFLVTPIFIVGLYPGKLLCGWALNRAARRDEPAAAPLRLGARLLTVPVVAAYVFFLFFTQFTAEHGKMVLFEHHAFLLLIGS